MQELITSKRNPHVQRVRKLLGSRHLRMSENCFVVEGVRLVEEAMRSGWTIMEFYFSKSLSGRGKDLILLAKARGIDCYQVSKDALEEISETDAPQGVVAVLKLQPSKVPVKTDLILVLDAIRDPGNVGTILRTSLAAGVDAVFIAPETADPYAPKVLRSAMGAQLKIPVVANDWQEIESLIRSRGIKDILLADIAGGQDLWNIDLSQPLALIVSNEACGPSEAARRIANSIITIPMKEESESLNAAIAASVLIYEVCRQRKIVGKEF